MQKWRNKQTKQWSGGGGREWLSANWEQMTKQQQQQTNKNKNKKSLKN